MSKNPAVESISTYRQLSTYRQNVVEVDGPIRALCGPITQSSYISVRGLWLADTSGSHQLHHHQYLPSTACHSVAQVKSLYKA